MNEKRKLAEAIMKGEVKLLGVDEVAAKLGVSRSTLERWIRNSKLSAIPTKPAGYERAMSFSEQSANAKEGNIKFPSADLMLGKAYRWQEETVVKWLMDNMQDADQS